MSSWTARFIIRWDFEKINWQARYNLDGRSMNVASLRKRSSSFPRKKYLSMCRGRDRAFTSIDIISLKNFRSMENMQERMAFFFRREMVNLSSIIKILNENKEDFSNLGNKDIEKFFQMDNLNQILRDVPRM